jgi:small GTP-binding protein
MIRIVLLGDTQSGKTTLFDSLLYNESHDSYCTTITPNYGQYREKYILYDTPADDRWIAFATPYIEVSDAAIIIYDGKAERSVEKWKKILHQTNRKQIPILIVVNTKNNWKEQPDVLSLNFKTCDNIHDKLHPFLSSLTSDPKISIGWVEYVYLLFPTVEDVVDHIPGCLQQ